MNNQLSMWLRRNFALFFRCCALTCSFGIVACSAPATTGTLASLKTLAPAAAKPAKEDFGATIPASLESPITYRWKGNDYGETAALLARIEAEVTESAMKIPPEEAPAGGAVRFIVPERTLDSGNINSRRGPGDL
jgi:hypothetical protein